MLSLPPSQKPTLPSFIRKLFQILNSPTYSHIICWDKDGKSIKIFDFKDLQEQVLDQEFRHKNHRSFIRQLNMYGFKKMRKSTTNTIYFFHPLFVRDGEEGLVRIERKRENKRRMKLEMLEESDLVDGEGEEARRLKKRKAVLKFLGMERNDQVVPQESLSSVSPPSFNSPSPSVKTEKVINPTNLIKERKTSINVVSDPLKATNINKEQLSKKSFELQTNLTLRRQELQSENKVEIGDRKQSETKISNQLLRCGEVISLKTEFSSEASHKGGFTTYEPQPQIQSLEQQKFQMINIGSANGNNNGNVNGNERVYHPMPMQMFGFPQCMYQMPQFQFPVPMQVPVQMPVPVCTQPMYFQQPQQMQQFQYFGYPQ